MPIRLPFPYGDSSDPDATLSAGTPPNRSRTRPAPAAHDNNQSPYPLPIPSSPYQHQPASTPIDIDPDAPTEARYPGRAAPPPGNGGGNGNGGNDGNHQRRNWGIVGVIIVVLLIVGVLVIHPSGTTSLTQTATPTTTTRPTATTAPTALPTATTTPTPCALPTTTADVKAPSISNSFYFHFATGVAAWYSPASEQEANGSVTLPISLCLPNHSFAQLVQAISVDSTFWHTASPCTVVACWSMASTSLGTPYTLSLTLAHTATNDTGAVFTLAMTTIAANHGSLATTTDTYIIQPNATTPDIGWASPTSVKPLGTALVALPAAGLTYDTLHLSSIVQDCGNTQPAYSARAVDVTVTGSICASTNTARYAKLKISYTSEQITVVSGVVYPTVFW